MSFINYDKNDVKKKITFDNPWWQSSSISDYFKKFRPRSFFDPFFKLVHQKEPKRAVVLMGPRRVGKTVLIHHAIQELIDKGINPRSIFFFSLDKPIYSSLDPEYLMHLAIEASGSDTPDNCYVFFDEVQYFKDWEIYLKTMVDSYHSTKFITSGSAAAALKRKSLESGAGRFTDFMLPPLTFAEFIDLSGKQSMLKERSGLPDAIDMDAFNKEFVNYINYGGYPELVINPSLKEDLERYIAQDIIDKVLLKDLPGIFGIRDTQQMNSFFNVLAYNTSNETSMINMERDLQTSKHLIENYLEFLQSAFLVHKLPRVDISARRLKKEQQFKIYLTNVSFRSAMFTPVEPTSDQFGGLVETAIFDQLVHRNIDLRYARWKEGRKTREVDIVSIKKSDQSPDWALEVKWSNSGDLANVRTFASAHNLKSNWITSLDEWNLEADIKKIPASIMCYQLGKDCDFLSKF